ncbi:hypothetical protein [Streptomyces durocortorensis]|uniref:Uncharacterized protein n=1 Tax=Streptomyces durocortorensis TaxID=2811104 RepID=A0ABS2I737_9ACTN|nr:hypothetical protein [Streptomyces durocortorensis]MBM7058810.1 hypothetical protein [Streptomyces durocortorensis]
MSPEMHTRSPKTPTIARATAPSRPLLLRYGRTEELFASGRFPLLAQVHEESPPDLDELFEYSLARHLDGFAILVGER